MVSPLLISSRPRFSGGSVVTKQALTHPDVLTPFQIGISARLHPLGLARHLRGARGLPIMLSCIDAACCLTWAGLAPYFSQRFRGPAIS
jgi:hypothetical protein